MRLKDVKFIRHLVVHSTMDDEDIVETNALYVFHQLSPNWLMFDRAYTKSNLNSERARTRIESEATRCLRRLELQKSNSISKAPFWLPVGTDSRKGSALPPCLNGREHI